MPEKRILLVEGLDDKHVLWALLERHAVPECFEVRELKGVEAVLERLPVFLKDSEVTRLGVLVDADIHPQGRWQRLTKVFGDVGYASPPVPDTTGTVMAAHSLYPRVGVWLMPDNQSRGALEDFLAMLVPANDLLWDHADKALNDLPEYRFPALRRAKAHLRTWLAWQEEPGAPPGQAITKRYLDSEHAQALALMAWIRRLFVEE